MDGRRRRFGHFRPIRSPQVEGPRYIEPQPQPEKPPIQESQQAANPQKTSPLYDGRIPPEIRNSIFQFTLTEEDTTAYEPNNGYSRPGYTHRKGVNTALLQTCRLIYLETYHLPPATKQHVFWHPPETGPHGRFYRDRNGWEREREMFKFRMTSWQVDLVREIHIFTQQFWLEEYFPKFCEEGFLRGVEKVKIAIRRCDWWWNERNHPLAINPYRGNADTSQMMGDMVASKEGNVPEWNAEGWGAALGKLPVLKEVEIELETSDDKVDELMAIVEWAKGWRFPLKDGRVLSTEGVRAKGVQTWQGPMCWWSQVCPYCSGVSQCRVADPPNERCAERVRLRALSKGPVCSVYTLRWRATQDALSSGESEKEL
ncbi:hypothetical protein ONS95_012574 [Cadophora gregata]|uniref:uncharacterized protein n=1 Tax=Cadophora gregata TaxID=51156 RepID=UPI0026DC7FB2|nr:uncharacterized protein ONS95_012574 [Cadophora gregata]KAK0118275.1 hypothetical protein ONS95_012574 [Cadophora gregata]KAK0123346.1 hypothetical protein ONS96_010339 [Cadophora gregata f. sp. sojae]